MSKKSLLITLVIILAGVSLFFILRQRGEAPTQEQPTPVVTEEPTTPTEFYPQHIEAIPGNTDEVWYNIPELGVRMRLNKGFAEDLIYIFDHENNTLHNEEWDAAYFSTKELNTIDKGCSPGDGSPLGVITKSKGDIRELAMKDEYFSSRLDSIVQIDNYYYMWTGPQATCWNPKNDEAIQKTRLVSYSGPGAKYVSEGIKTLELIP